MLTTELHYYHGECYSKKELTDAFMAVDRQHIGYISMDIAMNFLQEPPFSFPVEKVCYTAVF